MEYYYLNLSPENCNLRMCLERIKTEEAVVNKLGFRESKAKIESIDGSVIIKLG